MAGFIGDATAIAPAGRRVGRENGVALDERVRTVNVMSQPGVRRPVTFWTSVEGGARERGGGWRGVGWRRWGRMVALCLGVCSGLVGTRAAEPSNAAETSEARVAALLGPEATWSEATPLPQRREQARRWEATGELQQRWRVFADFQTERGLLSVWRTATYNRDQEAVVAPEAMTRDERAVIAAYWRAQFTGHWLAGRVAGAATYASLVRAWEEDPVAVESVSARLTAMRLEDEPLGPAWQEVFRWLRSEVGPLDMTWPPRVVEGVKRDGSGETWPAIGAVWLLVRHGQWTEAKREAELLTERCLGNPSVRRYSDRLLRSAASAGDDTAAKEALARLQAAVADETLVAVEAAAQRRRLEPAGVVRGAEIPLAAALARRRFASAVSRGNRSGAEAAWRTWELLDPEGRPGEAEWQRLAASDPATKEDRARTRTLLLTGYVQPFVREELEEALRVRGDALVNQIAVVLVHWWEGNRGAASPLVASLWERRRFMSAEERSAVAALRDLEERLAVRRRDLIRQREQAWERVAAWWAQRGLGEMVTRPEAAEGNRLLGNSAPPEVREHWAAYLQLGAQVEAEQSGNLPPALKAQLIETLSPWL